MPPSLIIFADAAAAFHFDAPRFLSLYFLLDYAARQFLFVISLMALFAVTATRHVAADCRRRRFRRCCHAMPCRRCRDSRRRCCFHAAMSLIFRLP